MSLATYLADLPARFRWGCFIKAVNAIRLDLVDLPLDEYYLRTDYKYREIHRFLDRVDDPTLSEAELLERESFRSGLFRRYDIHTVDDVEIGVRYLIKTLKLISVAYRPEMAELAKGTTRPGAHEARKRLLHAKVLVEVGSELVKRYSNFDILRWAVG
jgi:hypothetical protein